MHSLTLSKPSVCPPDGFRYLVPETGFVAHSWTYDAWVEVARLHYSGNNMEIPSDLESLMQNQLCQTLPPGWCNYDDPNRPRVNLSMTWDDVKGGVDTFTRWIKSGLQFVSKKEANRRAMICTRCYMNANVSGCSACHAAAKALVMTRHTNHDSHLRACGVCKCLLRAKVHFPLSVLDNTPGKEQLLYPEFCWLKFHGPNRIDVPD